MSATASFEDGLGVRVLEDLAGERVERLVVRAELVALEPALRDRVSRLANFRHVRYPRIRSVESSGQGVQKTVSVVADLVDGIRLSTLLDTLASRRDVVLDINGSLQVARELLPALAVLHDSRNVSHGAIGPERVVLNRDGRVVVVDHVFGLALERLKYPRSRLWREFRIAMPPSAGLPQFDPRADIAQVALLVLALVLGRSVAAKEFPDAIRTLLAEAHEPLGGGASRPMTASLRAWFERALPIESRKPFATALEAQIALEGVITRELAYAPRPGSLRSFVEQLTKAGGDAVGRRGSAGDGAEATAGVRQAGHADGRTSTRRRSGTGRSRGPSPEEVEAEEIRRLEAELQRLMDLEQQSAAPIAPDPAPVAQGFSPANLVATPVAETVVQLVAEPKPHDQGEDELEQLAALVDTFAEPPIDASLVVHRDPVAAPEPVAMSADVIEISLDDALDLLLEEAAAGDIGADASQSVLDEAPSTVASDAGAPIDARGQPAPAGPPPAELEPAEVYAEGVVWLLLLPPPAESFGSLDPGLAAPEPAVLADDLTLPLPFDAEPEPAEEVYAEGVVWLLLLPPPAESFGALEPELAAPEPAVLADDLTLPLPFDAEPEPLALAARAGNALAAVMARRQGSSDGRAVDDVAADLQRIQRLWPRAVPRQPATAVPLRRVAVPRRPAALGPGPATAAALASEATPVFAAMARYEAAGALVASPALAAAPVETAAVVAASQIQLVADEPILAAVDAVEIAAGADIEVAFTSDVDGTVELAEGFEAPVEAGELSPADVETLLAEIVAVEQDDGALASEDVLLAPEDDAFAPEGITLDLDEVAFETAEMTATAADNVYDLGAAIDQTVPEPAVASVPDPRGEAVFAWSVDVEATVPPDVAEATVEVGTPEAGELSPADVETLLAEIVAAEQAEVADARVDDLDVAAIGGTAPESRVASEAAEPSPTESEAAVAEGEAPGEAAPAAAFTSEPSAIVSKKPRRRRKGRKATPKVESEPEPVGPVAPWLRGVSGARPGDAPLRQPTSLSDPVAPPSAGLPAWARRGREPLPVVPLGEAQTSQPSPNDVAASLRTTLAPVADPVAVTPEPAIPMERSAQTIESIDQPSAPVAQTPVRPAVEGSVETPAEVPAAAPSGRGKLLRFPSALSERVNWRRTAAAAVVLLLIEGVALATAYWLATPREMGFLVIQTSVAGVDVLVDGQKRGRTPAGFELPPGRHTIELRGFGTSKVLAVEITGNVQTTQSITWPKAASAGTLRVSSSPPGAHVSIDGQPAGPAPVTIDRLAVGTHTVVVQNESGAVEQAVRVRADELTEIDVPIYSGWLALFAPVEVRIFLQGRMIGTSFDGRILMPPGRHQVELVNTALGYRETRTVVVTPGRVTAVSVDAPRGTVTFDAPDGTEVLVDGDQIGVTPLGEVSVPVGTREVTFKNPQLGQRRVTVVVRVGAPSRATMLAPR